MTIEEIKDKDGGMRDNLIVITGTAHGIGRAVIELYRDRKDFAILGIDPTHPEPAETLPEAYWHFQEDATDEVCWKGVHNWVEMYLNGGCSNLYVVNNCGVNWGTYPTREDTFNINLFSQFLMEDYVVKPFKWKLQAVVNMASVCVYTGMDGRDYNASKGAVWSYTRYLANMLGPYSARVNSISGGAGETELNRKYLDDPALYNAIAEQNLLKRWGTADEYARVIKFLLEDATFMTGQDIVYDGGESVMTRYIRAPEEGTDGYDYPLRGNL